MNIRFSVAVLGAALFTAGTGCELISGVSELEVVETGGQNAGGSGAASVGGNGGFGNGGAGNGGAGNGGTGNTGGQACSEPGALGQACCDGACADSACVGGTCVACGELDQPCCATDTCNGGLSCNAGTCGGCIAEIEAGGQSTCARLLDGTLRCAGLNSDGDLGIGVADFGDYSSPIHTPAVADVTMIAGDQGSGSCVTDGQARLWCWGDNGSGEVGIDSNLSEVPSPALVTALTAPVTAVGRGPYHTCATAGMSYCWGDPDGGALGNGTPPGALVRAPVPTIQFPGTVVEWALVSDTTCARTDTNNVWCWGKNVSGHLANGMTDFEDHPTPIELVGLSGSATQLAVSFESACAATIAGEVKCWGSDGFGSLGNPAGPSFAAEPTTVPNLTDIDALEGSYLSFCSLKSGAVSCWGRNYDGEIGIGTLTFSVETPTPVIGLPPGIVQISAGYAHVCARTEDGLAYCWGRNLFGQLGRGTLTDAEPAPALFQVTCPQSGQ